MKISRESFIAFIWEFYRVHGRQFDWRATNNPYEILVSEIMLQQTQTSRVQSYYSAFLEQFPNFQRLADASLSEVIIAWQGLGYNRRARFLHETAKQVVHTYDGILPHDPIILNSLPGIGKNTAGSIATFAFQKPAVFIETNIRTVFLHQFFPYHNEVSDAEILPFIAQTVCHKNPRHWYYALMDYGVYLKKQVPNPSRRSKHYTKQSRFEGSDRQIRGKVLALLGKEIELSFEQLQQKIVADDIRLQRILIALMHEHLIVISHNFYRLG